jgi:hypothetical protein
MDAIDRNWMIFGVVAIATVSSLIFTVGVMTPFVPMPLYLFLLAWLLSYGFLLVMPAVYLLVFKFLRNKRSFGWGVFIATLVFSVLSIFYFSWSWEYGVKYQGEVHTKIVAVENIVGFIGLLVVAYLGIRNNSKVLQYSANLYLFLLLSWCAFPYLGELP